MKLRDFMFCLLLASACVAGLGAYEQRRDGAVLLLEGGEVKDGRITVRLSDALTLSLRVEGPPTLQVEALRKPTTSVGWQVRPKGTPATTPCGDGRICWQQSFVLRPERPGDLTLVVAPLRYREQPNSDRLREVSWQPIRFQVATDIQHPSLDELRDVTGPEELPAEPTRKLPILWIGLVCLLVAGLVGGGLVWRRPRPRPATRSPAQWALAELEHLPIPATGKDGAAAAFHTRLSVILRTYLARQFACRAEEWTTAEVEQALRSSGKLPLEQVTAIHALLEACDLAKFARSDVSAEHCRTRIREAQQLVEQTAALPR
jgi:hypothetical protein